MGRLESGARLGLVAWAMVVTMARAVRGPNDFAEAHWLIDYRFGFVKRGLAGSVYSLLAGTGLVPQSAAAIAVLSFVVLAALAVALLVLARRVRDSKADPALSFAAASVFATSPFVVMAAHFTGYLDHLIVIVAIVAAWLAARGRSWPAAVLAAVGVLLHESFLLVGLPLVVVATSIAPAEPLSAGFAPLDGAPRNAAPPGSAPVDAVSASALSPEPVPLGSAPPGAPRPKAVAWRARYLPFVLPLAAALALSLSEALLLDLSLLRQQLTARLAAFPFVAGDMHVFVPEWLTTGSWENLRGQSHAFWRRLGDPNLLRLMAPSALFLAVCAALSARGARRPSLAALIGIATASPLLLHLVAWDTARIWTFTIVAAFACAWLIAVAADGDRGAGRAVQPRTTRLLLAGSVLIVVANMLGRSPLMDGEAERFSNPMRLFLYSPFLAGAALVLVDGWRGRRQ